MPVHRDALEAGWFDNRLLDGRGDIYDRNVIQEIGALLQHWIEMYELPWPFIYPTVENEVRVEWPSPAWEVVLTFDRNGSGVWLFATATEENYFVDQRFSTQIADTSCLGQKLARLLKASSAALINYEK